MEKFKRLNQYYKTCLVEFTNGMIPKEELTLENFEILEHAIYQYTEEIIKQLTYYVPYAASKKELPVLTRRIKQEESISLVGEFLRTISPIYEQAFYEGIQTGKIQFTSDEELCSTSITNDNFYRFYSCCGVVQNQYKMHVVTLFTLADAFSMVHEFFHYYNHQNELGSTVAYRFFTEGYSHFFEHQFYEFLKITSYKEEADIYLFNLYYSILMHASDFVPCYIAFDIYMNYGKIHSKSIYHYCKDVQNYREYFASTCRLLRPLEESLKTYDNRVDSLFESGNYILMVPFADSLLHAYEKDKEMFLKDYEKLNDASFAHYVQTYWQEEPDYQKVFAYIQKSG